MSQAKSKSKSKAKPVRHPNFDPSKHPIDPARAMSDIPEPVRRNAKQIKQLIYQQSSAAVDERLLSEAEETTAASKWDLLKSPSFAEHLQLLQAARLIALPHGFYHNHSEQPLLSSLASMILLDMADIAAAMRAYPQLSRFGMLPAQQCSAQAQAQVDADEISNAEMAEDWEVILHPERFDTGVGSLATDIMACSVAVHVLSRCPTRQTVNQRYGVDDICQHMRSYLLSQCRQLPQRRHEWRRIALYAGHVLVAAHYLGFIIQTPQQNKPMATKSVTTKAMPPAGLSSSHILHSHLNVSSRCGLLVRYPNIRAYYINGWLA